MNYISLQDREIKRNKKREREDLIMKISLVVVALFFISRVLLVF